MSTEPMSSTEQTAVDAAHETTELRLDKATTDFIHAVAAQADVTPDHAASVIAVLACREFIAKHDALARHPAEGAQSAAQERERDLNTGRRMAAIELLLSTGHNWEGGQWHPPAAQPTDVVDAVQEDAARWRWLADEAFVQSDDCHRDMTALALALADTNGAECDAILDAARAAQCVLCGGRGWWPTRSIACHVCPSPAVAQEGSPR
jgi:hypothetical protein